MRKLLITFLLPKIVSVLRRRYGGAQPARHRAF